MARLFGCMAAHALLANVVVSPWWVPNLTVAGLVLAVVRTPPRWFALSALAGLFAILFAVRFQGPIFVSYLILGWTVRSISAQWDANDSRVLCLLVGAACLLMTLYAVWLDGFWSWSLVGWILVHLIVTLLIVPVIRSLDSAVGLARDRSERATRVEPRSR